IDKFENRLNYNNEFKGIDKFENRMECDEFEGINKSKNGLEIDKFEDWSKSNSSNSSIASSILIDNKGETYDLENLLLRYHKKYKSQILEIQNAQTILEQNQAVRHYGIFFKKSILFNLISTSFPKTFLVNIMHLFYENITAYMLAHWTDSFFADYNQNNGEYVLAKEI
ncbi:24632_t:CDS:2, partial [Cetraspora pellucida]